MFLEPCSQPLKKCIPFKCTFQTHPGRLYIGPLNPPLLSLSRSLLGRVLQALTSLEEMPGLPFACVQEPVLIAALHQSHRCAQTACPQMHVWVPVNFLSLSVFIWHLRLES